MDHNHRHSLAWHDIDGLPFIFRPTILYPPSYLLDDLAPTAVEHALAASPPARPPATVKSLDRRAPREPEYLLGPELEDRVTAPKQLIFPRRRLWVENDR